MSTLNVTINGQACEAQQGEYILHVARRNGIFIPTFCHHDSLSGLGSCRLCIVEVIENGWTNTVVSCVYPLSKECEIRTDSERITRIRKRILAMLRDRAPEAQEVKALCEMYGVSQNERYTTLEHEKCILCGLCVKACAELGAGAISSVGRGTIKKIATPYDEPSPDCVGCGSCAAVCPTGTIACIEESGSRSIWGKEFALVPCESCGKPFATQEELDYAEKLKRQAGAQHTQTDAQQLCDACKRKKMTDVLAHTYGAE